MYYALAEEEPGLASSMRIYLRSDSEETDWPSILLKCSISPVSCLDSSTAPSHSTTRHCGKGSRTQSGTWVGMGQEGGLAQLRDTSGPQCAKEAWGNALNHLPRTNMKIIVLRMELQTHLEASESLLVSLACGKPKSYCRGWHGCLVSRPQDCHSFEGLTWLSSFPYSSALSSHHNRAIRVSASGTESTEGSLW